MSDCDTSSESDESYDAFHQFCNGNPLRIMDWIRMGKVHINACDEDHGDSLLHWAARHRVNQLARFLIRRGCELNERSNADCQTPLDIYAGDKEMCDLLRKHGAKTSQEIGDEEDS